MRLPALLATLEREEARLASVRAARATVDAVRACHENARLKLERLERLQGSSRANPLALESARVELDAARLELGRARRALLRSMAD